MCGNTRVVCVCMCVCKYYTSQTSSDAFLYFPCVYIIVVFFLTVSLKERVSVELVWKRCTFCPGKLKV